MNNKGEFAEFPIAYKPGIHELEIRKYFDEDGRTFFPLKTEPVVNESYFICYTNRCGSNWLAEVLNATGLIGLADECFVGWRVRQTCHNRNLGDFSDLIAYRAAKDPTQAKGKFITKLTWDLLFFLVKYRVIPDLLPNPKFILMYRKDLAAQALSRLIAQKTGQWKSYWNDGTHGQVDLDSISENDIISTIDATTYHYFQFHRFFGIFGIEPVVVTYEALRDDRDGEIARLVDELSLNPQGLPWNIDESKIRLRRQSTHDLQRRLNHFYKTSRDHIAPWKHSEIE